MTDLTNPEFITDLNYIVGDVRYFPPEVLEALPPLDTKSLIHDFSITDKQAAAQADRQADLRPNLNEAVGEELAPWQYFFNQRLAVATLPGATHTPEVVAELSGVDNVSASRQVLGVGQAEMFLKAHFRKWGSHRYLQLGWRAITPELIPDDLEELEYKFSVLDALVMHINRLAPNTRPVHSPVWLGTGDRGERWWSSELTSLGMKPIYDAHTLRPFDGADIVVEQMWGGRTSGEIDSAIRSKESKDGTWMSVKALRTTYVNKSP